MALRFLFAFLLIAAAATGQAIDQQVLFPPPQFDNATQWGIGVGATPTHDACFVVGYNYTDGMSFAQYYDEDPLTKNMTAFGAVMYGAVMTGFDTTEMNPAGALLTTDKLTAVWSISTINDSNLAYGFAYYWSRPDNQSNFALAQTFTDPLGTTGRLYGGAMAGTSNGHLLAIGAAVYPVSGPSNTIPSTVEIWIRQANNSYAVERTLSNVENRTGLWGYSVAVSEDERWVAVGAWNYHPRSVFLYDRLNNYTLATTLAPFGDVTRFGYSISFSPDSRWLIMGVFQYPSPGFTGATLAFLFNATADAWDTNYSFFLTTGFDYGSNSPGQGSSVSISAPYTAPDSTTAWSLVYGMPYLPANSTDATQVGGVAVWTYNATLGNWTETLPPLAAFDNLNDPPVGFSNANVSNWRSTLTGFAPPDPFLDLGWPSTPNRMISYDACSVLVPGISNVGIATGFVFRWLDVTQGCPRVAPVPPVDPPVTPPVNSPVSSPIVAPVSPPVAEPPTAASPAAVTSATWSIAAISIVAVLMLVSVVGCNVLKRPVRYYY